MVKRLLALTAVVLLATAGPAAAQDYPPAGDDIAVSDGTVEPGQSLTLSAQIFQPGTSVTFTLFSAPVELGTATADANGVATITATIPNNTTPGTHTIEASGIGADGQPLTVTQTITVVGASSGAGNLSDTGSSSTLPATRVAIAAIAGGGLLVLFARKRPSAKAEEREVAGV